MLYQSVRCVCVIVIMCCCCCVFYCTSLRPGSALLRSGDGSGSASCSPPIRTQPKQMLTSARWYLIKECVINVRSLTDDPLGKQLRTLFPAPRDSAPLITWPVLWRVRSDKENPFNFKRPFYRFWRKTFFCVSLRTLIFWWDVILYLMLFTPPSYRSYINKILQHWLRSKN